MDPIWKFVIVFKIKNLFIQKEKIFLGRKNRVRFDWLKKILYSSLDYAFSFYCVGFLKKYVIY